MSYCGLLQKTGANPVHGSQLQHSDPPAGPKLRHVPGSGVVRIRAGPSPVPGPGLGGSALSVIREVGVVPSQRLGTLRKPSHYAFKSTRKTIGSPSTLTIFLYFFHKNAKILVILLPKKATFEGPGLLGPFWVRTQNPDPDPDPSNSA